MKKNNWEIFSLLEIEGFLIIQCQTLYFVKFRWVNNEFTC